MATRREIEEGVFASRLPSPARHIMIAIVAGWDRSRREGLPPFVGSTTIVGKWTGLARSTVTEYIVALEQAGWLERTPAAWLPRVGQLECRRRETISAEVRVAVFDRDGNACRRCGVTENLTLDHIYPWSLGGEDTVENLRVLCRPCNSSKGSRV